MAVAVLVVVAAAAEDLQPERVPPHTHDGRRLQPHPRSAHAHDNATALRFAWRDKTVKQWSARDWAYAYRDAAALTRTRRHTYAGVRHWIRLLENKPESGQYWLGGKVPEPRGRGLGTYRESCPGGYTPRTRSTQYPFCAALWPRGDDDNGNTSSIDQPPPPPRGHNYRGGRVMYAIGVGGSAGYQGLALNMSKSYRLHM